MGNKRRSDKAHDIGDPMPGTVGDSDGTIHDRQGTRTYDPDSVTVPDESETYESEAHTTDSATDTEHATEESPVDDAGAEDDGESGGKSTRMEYAERYGDSWPESRQRRFLAEHDVTAREMGWTLTE